MSQRQSSDVTVTGRLKVTTPTPVTALAAYFEIARRSKADIASESGKNSTTLLYRAIEGSVSRDYAQDLANVTGVDRELIIFADKKTIWHFELKSDGKAQVINPEDE